MQNEKIVIITGANRGTGLALVKIFAQAGWTVIGAGRSPQPSDLPANATYKQFDAADAVAAENFWNEVHNEHPNAQVCLVNNAGGYVSGSLIETSPEDFASQMQSCYFAAAYMTRGLAKVIPKARIFNVISSSALHAHKNNAAYGTSKAAEMHFFHSLQAEFSASQYQITNLYPTSIASKGPDDNAMTPEDLATFILEQADSHRSYYLRDVTLDRAKQ